MPLTYLIKILFRMFFSLFRRFSTKMVIVVRADLKMGQGKVATQCAHAAVSLYESALKSPKHWPLKIWLSTGQPKIILKVNDEQALQNLYEKAKEKDLNVCLIRDAGKTQVTSGTLTAVGLGPNPTAQIDELTKDFKLL